MKSKKLLTALIPLMFLSGCSSKEMIQDQEGKINNSYALSNTSEETIVIDTDAKIMYEVRYTIECDDLSSLINNVRTKVNDNEIGGYIKSLDQSESSANVVYKVPTDNLDLFVNYVDALDCEISNKNISAVDVSSSYSKLEAKLEVLNKSKDYYNEYLEDNEATLSLKDKISILDKINEIDAELYEYNNKKEDLDSKVDYSTVEIHFYKNVENEEESWFSSYGEYLGDLFVGIGVTFMYLLPISLICGVIFLAIFLPIKLKKRKAKNK